MLKTTPFNLFKTATIDAFLKREGKPQLLQTGQSLGTWKLSYLVFQVTANTRTIVIPTYRAGVCFYDQSTATGDLDIDDILERAENEHTRLWKAGTLPDRRKSPKRKEIRFSVGEYHEITTPHQSERYTFYEARIPIAGMNTEPYCVVAYAKWDTEEQEGKDSLITYGIGLPREEIGMVAWLCCRDEPTEYHKQLTVFEDGSGVLIISENNRLEFPPRTYTISKSQRYRFKYPETKTTTTHRKGDTQ